MRLEQGCRHDGVLYGQADGGRVLAEAVAGHGGLDKNRRGLAI
jgi:hypothetical protein